MFQLEIQACQCSKDQPMPILYFCIDSICSQSRIVCRNCQSKHKFHQKIVYESQQSYDMLNISLDSKNKVIIEASIDTLLEKTKNIKDKLIVEINEIFQLVNHIFDEKLKQELEFFKKALNKKLPSQIRSIIANPSVSSSKLSNIAHMMRELNKPDYSNSLWVRCMKEYMEESMSNFQVKINQPLQQLRKQLHKIESLSPFSEEIEIALALTEVGYQVSIQL